MDFSEQQQYNYLYHHHHQQQQEEAAAAAYNPSQSQSQSYDAYYAYHQQQQQQQYYDYSANRAYPQPDPAAVSTAAVNTAHYSSQIRHPGLNPAGAAAAMTALSQLSEFGGAMDASERAMAKGAPTPMPHSHQYPQHYQMEHGHVSIRPGGGGGRRGGGPFRSGRRGGGLFRGGGGGRGNFSHRPTRQDGEAPGPFRGRGRGRGRRGGGRKQQKTASDSQPTHTATAPVLEQSSSSGGGNQQATTQAQPALVLPQHPLLPIAWCDTCRVDCNSLEILEQHKNGKRHKKTVQRLEEIQRKQKLFAEIQAKIMPDTMLPSAVAEKAVVPENVATAAVLSAQAGQVIKACATVDDNPKMVTKAYNPESKPIAVLTAHQDSEAEKAQTAEGQLEPSKMGEATEAPSSAALGAEEQHTEGSTGPPRSDSYNPSDRRRGGKKRKMTKFGRGGKRLKSFEPVRGRAPERPKERPRVCTLCNVMCESLVVFESHISGKKHASKIKRLQGQETVYGPITVYIPPNQPSAYPMRGQEPLFYGLKSQEMLHHETYMGLNGMQAENLGFHNGVQGKQDRDAEGGVSEPQVMEGLVHAEAEVVPAKGDKEFAVMGNTENQAAAFESKETGLLPGAPETSSSEAEAALSLKEKDALPVPEFGTLHGNEIVLPGLDSKME